MGTSGCHHPYAELHCRSAFSFRVGADRPEEIAAQAARLGLEACAITDVNGLYGAVRFARAASDCGLRTVFGAQLSLTGGGSLVVLARGARGYSRLSRTMGEANLRGGPPYDLEELAGPLRDHVVVLTGHTTGRVPSALVDRGHSAAARELDRLIALFGTESVVVELVNHADPTDDERNDALWELASSAGVGAVATNDVRYTTPGRARLAAVLAAVRTREIGAAGAAYLRDGDEMNQRFAAYPGSVRLAAALGAQLSFPFEQVTSWFSGCGAGERPEENHLLRQRVSRGAAQQYGRPEDHPAAYAQLSHELGIIESLGFAGYFLVVHDIVLWCRQREIYCQGRGSAANSAVCYALGITSVDPIRWGLLFERFLSPAREGPPDIDVDIESGRREEVISFVFDRYGRERAAQVATVITYRRRSATRDLAKLFPVPPENASDYVAAFQGLPRHRGIHSGGMVISERPLIELCPVERAATPGRTTVQWDKDDCAAAGLVKFDLLGLGMLSAIRRAGDLIGERLDLTRMALDDPEVYDLLCRADTVGVFQVESRAQMAMLPRNRPRRFYDLVIQIALVRPGPIQGDCVHPYLRRRAGREPVTYPHPTLEPALARTLGVPLFQEQLMRIAIDLAGFSPTEADELRQAMSDHRSSQRMERIRDRLYTGMAVRGIVGATADELFERLAAFANYGFPESHAISFAYLVYASAWLKRYHPAALCAGLLNSQPMGFYPPQTLVDDVRRHGVVVLRPDVNLSSVGAGLGSSPSALRLGLGMVRAIGSSTARRIVAERGERGAYLNVSDLIWRSGLTARQVTSLAEAGALESLGAGQRGLGAFERMLADVRTMGVAAEHHPVTFARDRLRSRDAVPIAELGRVRTGGRTTVGGVVTACQTPATAGGITFLNLEDETGMLNVVCSEGLLSRQGASVPRSLVARGILERTDGAMSLRADRLEPLRVGAGEERGFAAGGRPLPRSRVVGRS